MRAGWLISAHGKTNEKKKSIAGNLAVELISSRTNYAINSADSCSAEGHPMMASSSALV